MPSSLGAHSAKLSAVRELRTKRGRKDQQRFTVEGPTLLAEALDAGRQPEAIFATEAGYEALGALLPRLACDVFLVPERAMARLSELTTPPGIVAVMPLVLEPTARLLAEGAPAALLAGIADPGNAGTLLRSAEIFGLPRVIFARGGVEPYNPKVVRASMGAIFRARIALADADEVLQAARSSGHALVATTREGIALPQFRFPRRSLVAIGNERHGVGEWLPRWDFGVSIPHVGAGESLNAAIAGSIVFYALAQQLTSESSEPTTPEKP